MQDHSTLLSHPASHAFETTRRLWPHAWPFLRYSLVHMISARAPGRDDAAIGDLHPVAAGLIERKNFCWKARRCGPVFDEDTVLQADVGSSSPRPPKR